MPHGEVTEEQVWEALRAVPLADSERLADLVSGLSIRDGVVSFALEIGARGRDSKEGLRAALSRAAAAVPGVRRVNAVLTAAVEPGAAGPPAEPGPNTGRIPGVAAIVAVASGKGGVGKSTTAVNLALGLRAAGQRVGLLDADIYGPSLPRLLGTGDAKPAIDGGRIVPVPAFGLATMSMGYLVPEDTATVWRGPMATGAIQQFLRKVAWGELDVLVVDFPPGTGDIHLTLAQSVPITGAVIVSTPQDIALIDARKGIRMFERVNVPVLGLVENMSYFVCPHCGERSEIFGHGGARAEADATTQAFLGEIPLDGLIRETSDAGTPIVATAPDSPQGAAYLALARRVLDKLAAARTPAPVFREE